MPELAGILRIIKVMFYDYRSKNVHVKSIELLDDIVVAILQLAS